MEPNLFKYIWRFSKAEQFSIIVTVLLSLPFYFLSLDVPKKIVNIGIQGEGFRRPDSTLPFGDIALPFSETLFGEQIMLFEGVNLDQMATLMCYSGIFLVMVFVNGGFKFYINTSKGRLGERMLRRLRFDLTDRLLRFSLPQVRRMKGAEVATMVKDEVEPLGGFIGDAFVTPIFMGGQAITAMVFIMVQSFWLGLVAGVIVLAQAILIPKLRVAILRLGKERQLTARALAGRVSELMDGAVEVHANDASNWERAEITSRLGRIFDIRFEIYQRKFFVKFLNNFMSQLTPFFFYSIGGYLALTGRLDLGALVAVIAAYKDLPGPIRELINWEQRRNDVQIKYDQVVEQFAPAEIMEPERQDPDQVSTPLQGPIKFSSLVMTDENNNRLLDGFDVTVPLDKRIAVVGDSSSGKEFLSTLLSGLISPASGSVQIGDQRADALPEAVLGRRISYVEPHAYLFPLSVRENLLYGLRHKPLVDPVYDGAEATKAKARLAEIRRSANNPLDLNADWVDYEAAGVTDSQSLSEAMIDQLVGVGLEEDVYGFGLNGTIDPKIRPKETDDLLRARAALTDRLEADGNSDLVMRFDPELYNTNATLAENLLFGTPRKADYETDKLADNKLVKRILDREGLAPLLAQKGLVIAQTMVEIFADLPPGHPFFEQFSFIDADDLPEFTQVVTRAEQKGLDQLAEEDINALMRLPFIYVEARHRLALVDEDFSKQVLAVRHHLAEAITAEDPGAVAFYDPQAYNAAASVMDNVLFGRLVYGQAEGAELVGRSIRDVLDSLNLRHLVMETGLDYDVGVGGKRLRPVQQQKLALARALLKRPDLMVINEATAIMDGTTRADLVDSLLAARADGGLFWVLERASLAEGFDHILVVKQGRLAEQGSFESLNKEGTHFCELMSAD
ncbi:ATP-binding cassette domain-containing protein [Rhodovibrionaceae bacterium A322]